MSTNGTLHFQALNNLRRSRSVSLIANDQSIHGDVKTNIENFISDNDTLRGESWNCVRNKLAVYRAALNMRFTIANNLTQAINDAVKILLDYLGEDIFLDSSKLEEIKRTKQQCENLIASLESSMYSKQEVKVVDGKGKITYKFEYIYSSAEREEMNNKIRELRDETIPKLDELIAKIEGLPEIYEQAKKIIRAVYSEIESFNSNVLNIIPSAKATVRTSASK